MLTRVLLLTFEVVGASVPTDDDDDDDVFGHHRREYFVYSATRPTG